MNQPPVVEGELNQICKDAVNYYLRQSISERNGNGNGLSRANNKIDASAIISSDIAEEEEEERLTAKNTLSADDINFVINTIKKRSTMSYR
jgi:NACalpha-BTF3-like transcription factor